LSLMLSLPTGLFPSVFRTKSLYKFLTITPPPLRSHWNIGPQQLSVVEVSVALNFFTETGLIALWSNPQPGRPGLHIYIPWRRGGPVIPPGTEYPF
jgi:hypothetical protein